ncbi:unnamed protein product [Sphagnum tenellum]
MFWMSFVFNWFITFYFWMCVLSSYQISRLPDNYDEILENREQQRYDKSREKETNKVYEEIINDMYLEKMQKLDKID